MAPRVPNLAYNPQSKEIIEGVAVGGGTYQPITMNGKDVYRFAVQRVPQVIDKALFRANLSVDQVDWLLHHRQSAHSRRRVERMNIPSLVSNLAPHMAHLCCLYPSRLMKPCGRVRFNQMISLPPPVRCRSDLGQHSFHWGR